jgi:hypothetical protein
MLADMDSPKTPLASPNAALDSSLAAILVDRGKRVRRHKHKAPVSRGPGRSRVCRVDQSNGTSNKALLMLLIGGDAAALTPCPLPRETGVGAVRARFVRLQQWNEQ